MRVILAVCVLVAGCDARTAVVPAIEQTRVLDQRLPVPQIDRVDVLFVIDRSPALAPHRTLVERVLAEASASFGDLPGYADLHVGVVSADLGANAAAPAQPLPGECAGWGDGGALLRSPLVDGAFIAIRDSWAGEHTNVLGSLSAALPGLADLDEPAGPDLGDSGCSRAQPLEAMRIALDDNPHNAGFLRANARLIVILISAQMDRSPRSFDEYAAFLHHLEADPNQVWVFVASDDAQLRSFADLFPNRSERMTMDGLSGQDLALDAYYTTHPWGPGITSPCLDAPLLDTDPETAGIQPDCVVTERWPSGETVIPACSDGPTLPCWRVDTDPQNCIEFPSITLDRPDVDPPDHAVDEAQCVPQ